MSHSNEPTHEEPGPSAGSGGSVPRATSRRRLLLHRCFSIVLVVTVVWLVTAYLIPPALWQDLAFEKPAGRSASRRHHVRFWRSGELGQGGEPLWIGAATFDRSVGLSHRTGQVTHHIAPDVDTERDGLVADLVRAGQLGKI